MHKVLLTAVVAVTAVMLTGCAMVQSPVNGAWYTNVKAAHGATSNTGSSKIGSAKANSFLGLIALGDASIETAAKNAGITKIHHVDYKAKSILGLWSEYTVMVHGE